VTDTKPRLTCAFINMKAGSGKTTTAAWTLTAWHEMGLTPLGVDTDRAGSLLRWSDRAGSFPFTMIGCAAANAAQQIVTMTKRGEYGAVGVDTPQMEDHIRIVRPLLECVDLWVVTVAANGIELDRMIEVRDEMDRADSRRDRPGRRIVALNRTWREQRSKGGADAIFAPALADMGFTVLDRQIPRSTTIEQSFGTYPKVPDTPFSRLAADLRDIANEGAA